MLQLIRDHSVYTYVHFQVEQSHLNFWLPACTLYDPKFNRLDLFKPVLICV